MADNAIRVSNVSKAFKLYRQRQTSLRERFTRRNVAKWEEFWALRDVSFDVVAGTSFGLVGHNGSGKSTLLKLMAQIYRPTSGSVATCGRMSALLELGAGFHPDLTGRENLFLNGAILGLSKRQIKAQFDDIVDFSGIGEFIDSPVKIYSSGMVVRLGFSIAAKVDPEILLVDEVVAVGDEEFQRKCFDYMFDLRKSGTTIVIVSHALSDIRALCDHGLWIEHGTVRNIGKIDDVVDSYLSAVNSREAQRVVKTVDAAPLVKAHTGSGEARITWIEFRSHGSVAPVVISGAPVTVRIFYQAMELIEAADFGLRFTTGSGILVAEPFSRRGDQYLRIEPGAGYVDFVMDSLLLSPGTYRVSTGIIYQGHFFDLMDDAAELHVRQGPGLTYEGLIRMPGRWTIHPSR